MRQKTTIKKERQLNFLPILGSVVCRNPIRVDVRLDEPRHMQGFHTCWVGDPGAFMWREETLGLFVRG
jgi:hypothetical protein